MTSRYGCGRPAFPRSAEEKQFDHLVGAAEQRNRHFSERLPVYTSTAYVGPCPRPLSTDSGLPWTRLYQEYARECSIWRPVAHPDQSLGADSTKESNAVKKAITSFRPALPPAGWGLWRGPREAVFSQLHPLLSVTGRDSALGTVIKPGAPSGLAVLAVPARRCGPGYRSSRDQAAVRLSRREGGG